MLPDRVSNPGPLTCESGVLPIALRGPAKNQALNQALFSSRDKSKKLKCRLLQFSLCFKG